MLRSKMMSFIEYKNTKQAIPPVRFFSGGKKALSLPPDYKFFSYQPDPKSVRNLLDHHKKITTLMKQTYPHLLMHAFQSEIGYTLNDTPPEKMLADGGLYAKSSDLLWLSNTGSGQNSGSVCLSLLPEVTTLFYQAHSKLYDKEKQPAYVYAFTLNGLLPVPGGLWREVIFPGALPLLGLWAARPVIEATLDRRLILGPMIGNFKTAPKQSETFISYTEKKWKMPDILAEGNEDHSPIFNIIDTPKTAKFQETVAAYYRELLPDLHQSSQASRPRKP